MVDVLKTMFQHERGRFLTPNTPCAKHGHSGFFTFFCGQYFGVFDPLRQLRKTLDIRIDSTFERSNFYLVVVAGINDHNIRSRDQIIPVFWLDILPYLFGWA